MAETHPPHILLVDDSPSQLVLLRRAFQQRGFATSEAKNGAEALQMSTVGSFDCIISDCHMPFLDGYQLCRLIKDDPDTRHTPVLLLTSSKNRLSRFWARTCGADRFWVKSADLEGLVSAVESLLRERSSCAAPRAHGLAETGIHEIQKRLSEALERRLVEITLRNAVSALGAHIHDPAHVIWEYLDLMEEIVAPGVLCVLLPEPSGFQGFLLRSQSLAPATELRVQEALARKAQEQGRALRWEVRLSSLEGPEPTSPLELQLFDLPVSGDDNTRGIWALLMDPMDFRACHRLFQVAHEEFARLFDAMVTLELLAYANHRLVKADEAKTEFVNTVSHEIRSPLTATRGALGLMAAGLGGGTEGKQELLQIAQRNIDRTLRLVDGVLDLEKMALGHFRLELAPLDLRRVCAEAVQGVEGLGAEKGLRYTFRDEGPERCIVQGHEDRMVQCITNLLANASKFSPQGGEVTLRLASEGAWHRIEVQDQGPGVPEAFKDRIFRPFQQAGSQAGGTGLGLAITLRLAEAMGGGAGFHSREGEGATFFLRFPAQG